MEIRRATVADARAIADVHVRTWQAAYEHVFGVERLAGLDVDRRASGWERRLGDGWATFVAEKDGRVLGFVSVGEGELDAIYVLPEAWGSSAGGALMSAAVGALRAAGNEEAVLWVLEDNPRARRFYEREGWRADGGREGEHLGVRTAEVRYRIDL